MFNKKTKRSLIILIVVILLILILPEIIPGDPTDIALTQGNLSPGIPHIFGTDHKGRDSFLRVLYGTRLSLLIGLSATFVSLFIGVIYGAMSGMAGKRIDNLMMRFVDVMYGLPFMFVVIYPYDYPWSTICNSSVYGSWYCSMAHYGTCCPVLRFSVSEKRITSPLLVRLVLVGFGFYSNIYYLIFKIQYWSMPPLLSLW